jgi:mRNA-degrading endonuclease RelE of RelBE toxin-antitoxin system
MSPPTLKVARFRYKPSFKRDIRRLETRVTNELEKALDELKSGNLPPGRKLKKLAGRDTYSLRITLDYRLSFDLEDDTAILRRVGPRQRFYDSP